MGPIVTAQVARIHSLMSASTVRNIGYTRGIGKDERVCCQ
jgi:hypothetical protein